MIGDRFADDAVNHVCLSAEMGRADSRPSAFAAAKRRSGPDANSDARRVRPKTARAPFRLMRSTYTLTKTSMMTMAGLRTLV
ncbi:hypothetical protein A1D31_34705 [Bradyrhizobium liaoningense]|nr:hypothetical protein A1D31_34705 [Bradyrhizobium liaoningense]